MGNRNYIFASVFFQGEDNIEYYLGLTPSGIIVLRNRSKVGNYFWPRITKIYFKGKYFMLRVRDKNVSEILFLRIASAMCFYF